MTDDLSFKGAVSLAQPYEPSDGDNLTAACVTGRAKGILDCPLDYDQFDAALVRGVMIFTIAGKGAPVIEVALVNVVKRSRFRLGQRREIATYTRAAHADRERTWELLCVEPNVTAAVGQVYRYSVLVRQRTESALMSLKAA